MRLSIGELAEKYLHAGKPAKAGLAGSSDAVLF
jgi:hypothetical protein